MATALNQALGSILDNYADVIEGGNSWRGAGTVYRGIPGTYSNDADLNDGTDTPLAVVGTSVSTTTFDVTGYTWDESRWVKNDIPGYWAFCNTAGDNYQRARKVTGYNDTTKVFTVAPAFTGTPAAADSMVMLQGFKRIPNGIDIEADHQEVPNGYDRMFHLSALPGEPLEYHGRGVQTYKTDLELRLRFIKRNKIHDTVARAFENLATIAAVFQSGGDPNHRDGTYTRALWHEEGPEEKTNDKNKVVLVQKFILIYRIARELL